MPPYVNGLVQVDCSISRFLAREIMQSSTKLAIGLSDESFCQHLTLTHWGQDKMATIVQTTFPEAFLQGMKMSEFQLKLTEIGS